MRRILPIARPGLAAGFQVTLDMPLGMRAVLEEDDVSRTVRRGAHGVVLNHDGSFQDQDRRVEVLGPVELLFETAPDDGGKQVRGRSAALSKRAAFF